MAALERAAGRAGGSTAAADTPDRAELAFLSDTEALCDRALSSDDQAALIGAATTCSPQVRAAALAALVANARGPAKAELRARVLAGPLAVDPDPEHPGVARSVSALGRPGSSLRVAFELPLDPIWVVEGEP
jgi:hypothetical protein